jgi:hypothetical protein
MKVCGIKHLRCCGSLAGLAVSARQKSVELAARKHMGISSTVHL